MDMELEIAPIASTETGLHRIEAEDFDWIVVQHQRQVYRILLCLVKDADAADTLTQECFLRAFSKYPGFQGNSSLKTWLVRIAINLAHDHNRNRKWAFWRRLTRTDRIDTIPAPDIRRSPEQALLDRETIAHIFSVVERLSEQQKTVFLLHFVEEMTLDAIAAVMNLKMGTVKSHLSRALETVRSNCPTQTRQPRILD